MRRCRICGEEKPLESFHREKHGAGGRRWDCKACFAKDKRRRLAEHAAGTFRPKVPKRPPRQKKWARLPKGPLEFWDNAMPEPNTGCLIWLRALDGKGYGVFGRNPQVLAHRYAFELENGPIPDGLKVLHKCDNPPCINPRHMFLGGHRENIVDCVQKGRHVHTRLRPDDVREIRHLAASGETQKTIAARFNVSPEAVSKIVLRTRWWHVT